MKYIIITINLSLLLLLPSYGCAKKNYFPTLKGPYIGQTPPGLIPQLFAPGIISRPGSRDLMHGFFDDGKLFILYRYPAGFKGDWTKVPLILMKQVEGKWTAPYESRLVGKPWFYNLESVSEGEQVIFAWTKNLDGSGPPKELYLWSATRTGDSWADLVRFKAPVNTGFETWPSLSRDKTLYFFSRRPSGKGGFDIYQSIPEDGEYNNVQNLGDVVNTEHIEEDPFIAPDGSYLLFDSNRPGGFGGYDLYLTWRKEDGSWTKSVNLGEGINSKYSECRPYVTPDGKYLFFTSNRTGDYDAWWVSTKIIEVLDPSPGKYKILSDNGRIVIPFEFHRNKFRFKATVNGWVCNLLLDNGSLWDELLFFGSPKVDSIGFKITGETAIGHTKADIASDITVRLKDVVFHAQKAVITHYDPKLPNLWEGFDGQVSATFFKHFVVRIDFDEAIIELIPPGKFTYTGKGRAFSMQPGPFTSRTMTADIITHNGEAVTLDLLIDLGGLHPLYLPIGRVDRITLPPDAVEKTLGRGLFIQKGYLGTIKGVRFGEYVLKNVPTAFTVVKKESNVYRNTMIGLPLLRRFNIVFDYTDERIILEPSQTFNDPFKIPNQ